MPTPLRLAVGMLTGLLRGLLRLVTSEQVEVHGNYETEERICLNKIQKENNPIL
jgi:hypothetical protein